MRELIYHFENPETQEVIETYDYAQAQKIREDNPNLKDSIIFRELKPQFVFDGYNERGIKQYHIETLTEMMARG